MRPVLSIENDKLSQKQFLTNAGYALIFLLICRVIAMWFIPLNDVSEARYGEIARKMLETGNWVTLLHDYGVPFWAKPPLSTWLSAASMMLLGVNEFAVRLPGLLLSLGVLWLIWDVAKKQSGSVVAMLTTLVLAGTLYFFLDAGTVMTDPALVFCITLVQVAFWHAVAKGNKTWSYLFFVGLGLGLLAKGPVAVVLVAMPVFFWVLLRNEWRTIWNRLPWIKGICIVLAIALPWYIWAEIRTPGFLNYFIVGEHLNRFLTPGWTGDKYGFAHQEPWGMIWIFAAMGIFPWCLLGAVWFVTYRKSLPAMFRDQDGWMSYIFLGTVVPLFFFTFSSNIIYTYVFPCMPMFALFFTEYWVRAGAMLRAKKLVLGASMICGALFLVATVLFYLMPDAVSKTQKEVIAKWLKQAPVAGSKLIYWDYKTEFSAQFYARGKVSFAESKTELCNLLSSHSVDYIVISPTRTKQIPADLFSQMTEVGRVTANGRPLLLLRSPGLSCQQALSRA